MTVLSTFARVQITGLSSGWTRNYNIGALAAVPSGTTHAVVQFESNGTGSSWGVGNYEEVSAFTSGNVSRADQVKFIPLGASKNLDFYLSNTSNGKWWLIAYTDHINAITPVDKSGSVASLGTHTIDCSGDLPSGAAGGWALVRVDQQVKIGGVGLTAAQYKSMTSNRERIHAIVPLNSSRQFEINSNTMTAGQLTILGWMDEGAYQGSSDPSTNRYLHGATGWEELGYTSTTKLDHWRISNATTTSGSASAQISEVRPSGDTSFSRTDINSEIGHRFVVPNGSGKIQAYSTVAGIYYTWYGGFVADTAAPQILSVDTFNSGSTATITFDKSVSSFSNLAVKGVDDQVVNITTTSGSGSVWTVTAPIIADETEGVMLGAVTLNATTSGGVSNDFADVYTLTDYTHVDLEDVLVPNLGTVVGAAPEFKPSVIGVSYGTQVAYNPSEVTINVHGELTWAVDGAHDIYYYDPDDFTWRLITLTTEAGGGLTSSGLTSIGLTRVGLTSAGL